MKQVVFGVFAIVMSGASVSAQISYPMIMSLKPVAVQIGTTSECEVNSRYSMFGAHQVFVTGTGVIAEVVPPEAEAANKPDSLTKLKLKITVEPSAIPGVREFRLATPHGASTIGQLVVVRDPVMVESADNDSPEKAQPVTLPATLCGTIEKIEDRDFFKFHVEAGQSVGFHVRSQRLEDKIHDLQAHSNPIVFLRDAAGSLLAMSDNTFFADPYLAYQFAAAGDYFLEIRDVRYQGNAEWVYCIEANSRPMVSTVYPLAMTAGTETAVEPAGWLFPPETKVPLNVPEGTPQGLTSLPLSIGDQPTPPVPVYVTDLPVIAETGESNNEVKSAQHVDGPVVINGRMETEADVDCFAISSKKGEKWTFEVMARRAQSDLDPILRILNENGGVLKEEDDWSHGKTQRSADVRVEGWEAPAEGTFFLEVRDVHLRGGPGYNYALQITPTKPYFELLIDSDKTQLTPGTFGVLFVRANRQHGFTGEVDLHIDQLPPGVTAVCGKIQAGKGLDGAIVLHAAPDAALAASNVRIWGTATHPQGEGEPPLELTAEATPFQETYNPGGGRNFFEVSTHTVNVGQPADLLAIEVSETDLHLKPGESKTLSVTLKRAENMKHNVLIDMQFTHLERVFASSLPEGVTMNRSAGKTLLTGTDSVGEIVLTVDPMAPAVEKQLCCVMANISINFVMKATYSSPPMFITIEKSP